MLLKKGAGFWPGWVVLVVFILRHALRQGLLFGYNGKLYSGFSLRATYFHWIRWSDTVGCSSFQNSIALVCGFIDQIKWMFSIFGNCWILRSWNSGTFCMPREVRLLLRWLPMFVTTFSATNPLQSRKNQKVTKSEGTKRRPLLCLPFLL